MLLLSLHLQSAADSCSHHNAISLHALDQTDCCRLCADLHLDSQVVQALMLENARLRAEVAAQSAQECTRSMLQQGTAILQPSAAAAASSDAAAASSAGLSSPEAASSKYQAALAAKDDLLRLLQAELASAQRQVCNRCM